MCWQALYWKESTYKNYRFLAMQAQPIWVISVWMQQYTCINRFNQMSSVHLYWLSTLMCTAMCIDWHILFYYSILNQGKERAWRKWTPRHCNSGRWRGWRRGHGWRTIQTGRCTGTREKGTELKRPIKTSNWKKRRKKIYFEITKI